MITSKDMETSPSKSSRQFWRNFLSNPKSISSDSLVDKQNTQNEYISGTNSNLLRRPTITSRNISSPYKVDNAQNSSIEGENAKMNKDVNFKNYRDDFIQNIHGFTGSVFGNSLQDSLNVANAEVIVQGELASFGRIPIVVAKCGAYLKKNALDVSGIFRIAGSSKRVKQLQHIFSTPPDYGLKFVAWDGYTVHDVGSLLRRYLNNLKEPLIPIELFDTFREPLQKRPKLLKYIVEAAEQTQTQVNTNDTGSLHSNSSKKTKERRKRRKIAHDIKGAIKEYRVLFSKLSNDTMQLTVYLLDLLSLFSKHSNKNLMTGKNLSAIFQPSMLSHPDHDMDPKQYEISRVVIEFLIEYSYKLLPHLLKLTKDRQSGSNSEILHETQRNTLVSDRESNSSRNINSKSISGELSVPESDHKSNLLLVPPESQSSKVNDNPRNRQYSKSFNSILNPSDIIANNETYTENVEDITESGEGYDEEEEIENTDTSSSDSRFSIATSLKEYNSESAPNTGLNIRNVITQEPLETDPIKFETKDNNGQTITLTNPFIQTQSNTVKTLSPPLDNTNEREGRRSRRSSWLAKLYSRSRSGSASQPPL